MEASKPTAPAAAVQPTPPPVTQSPAPAQAPADDVEKYGVEGWKDRDRALGVSPHAIAGALHDVEADVKLTEQEVRDRLEKFLKRSGTEESS